jgi:Holliday junction resolvase RusA-like endonuclease
MSDPIEIAIDLPIPTSTNRLYERTRKGGVRRSAAYVAWLEEADATVMATRQYPRRKIQGAFEFELLLSADHRGDGDNFCKAALDWLQSRDVIRNDSDCRRGSWAWVSPEQAPCGARVILRSIHDVTLDRVRL